jgi:hypothetical protein
MAIMCDEVKRWEGQVTFIDQPQILLVSGRHVTSLCQQSLNIFTFLPLYSWCVVSRRVRSRCPPKRERIKPRRSRDGPRQDLFVSSLSRLAVWSETGRDETPLCLDRVSTSRQRQSPRQSQDETVSAGP